MTALLMPLAFVGLFAGEAHAEATLDLTVSGIAPDEGQLAVAVFANEADYSSGDNAIANGMFDVNGTSLTVTFEGLEAGTCAIKIFHDVNENGDLDTNLLGIPTEPFGFSNDAPARFGPPDFGDAAFTLEDGDNDHAITMAGV